jgi:hypothetical protein
MLESELLLSDPVMTVRTVGVYGVAVGAQAVPLGVADAPMTANEVFLGALEVVTAVFVIWTATH